MREEPECQYGSGSTGLVLESNGLHLEGAIPPQRNHPMKVTFPGLWPILGGRMWKPTGSVFRACPAWSELEPTLILGGLEAGVERAEKGREKSVCPAQPQVLGQWGLGGVSSLLGDPREGFLHRHASVLGEGRGPGIPGHKVLPVSQGPSQPPGCGVAG